MTQSDTTPELNVSTKDWLLIVLLSMIWGGSFLFGRILMIEWPPFTIVFLRVFLAAIALWVFLLFTSRKFQKTKSY